MDEAAKKHRDELATKESLKHWPTLDDEAEGTFVREERYPSEYRYEIEKAFQQGFDAGWAVQEERIKIAIDVICGFESLIEDGILVRETAYDHDTVTYMKNATRLVAHLAASKKGIAKIRGEG